MLANTSVFCSGLPIFKKQYVNMWHRTSWISSVIQITLQKCSETMQNMIYKVKLNPY
jgi:hypothetical protein